MKKSKENLMDKARANLCLANSRNTEEDFQLEAFMATFHPEKQKDRQYMNKLKSGMKGKACG